MTDGAWTALLHSIEDGLATFPPVLVEVLPLDAGPVPPALVERAVSTLARMAEAEATLERQRAEIGRELVGLAALKANVARAATSPVPRFLDTRA